ncbi:MAG: zinc ribbon domain-containing protein [Candidatus Margulisbacteria bacterium]|nr:zinc ribbon domain-containing protein [Candidatus Margulisiibacteriota bacterium]
MICSECQTENASNAKFCENCGKTLSQVNNQACPNCGTIFSKEDKFCNSCGSLLKESKQKKPSLLKDKLLPREERYRQARQLAIKLAQSTETSIPEAPIVYIGEKIT